jgi:hypothetical protein
MIAKKKRNRSLVKRVANVIRKSSEFKWYGTVSQYILTGTFGSPGNAIVSLCEIPQGVSDSHRVADALNLVSVRVRAYFVQNSSPPVSNTISWSVSCNVRCIVLQWFPTTTAPNVTDVLEGLPFTLQFAAYHHDNTQMFRILYDKWLTLVNGQEISNRIMSFDMKFGAGDKLGLVHYLNGGLLATNKLFVIGIADSQGITFGFQADVIYTDS